MSRGDKRQNQTCEKPGAGGAGLINDGSSGGCKQHTCACYVSDTNALGQANRHSHKRKAAQNTDIRGKLDHLMGR